MRPATLTRRAALAFALLFAFAADGLTQAPAVVSPRLYVLDGGVLRSDPTRYRLTRSEVQVEPLSIAAYLIVHPRGVLLWDAGAVPDAERISEEGGVEQRLVRKDGEERFVTLGPSLRSQLEAAGFKPEDVTHFALSHYHWDHTANANDFAHATWLVRPEDREVMFANGGPGGARPETYAALRNSRMVEITADEHDVFGDGKVILKFAPGHTEGHQVLYVDLERTGGVVLSGDLYHYPEERTLNRLPTFEVDEAQTAASRREMEQFLALKGATLWIQHDLTAHRLLKKAPEYYD
ncbi:MAG TPA: N-acyl homoserine lactonase family protein [Gammaproteobacteria bacterium]